MPNTTQTPPRPDTPAVGESVEVWCSFDRVWHAGFRVDQVDQTDAGSLVTLARADGSVLPTPVDAKRIRRRD